MSTRLTLPLYGRKNDGTKYTLVDASGNVAGAQLGAGSVAAAALASSSVTTAKIAANAVTAAKLDVSVLQSVTVSLTNAEIKALRAAPKTLVAAAGAGTVLEFVSATLKLVAGANVLTESTANLAVKYTDGSGAQVSQTIESTGFIDQAADTITNALPKIDIIVAYASAANKALVLHNLGAGEFGGNAANDATMTIDVYYRVHTI